MVWNRTFDRNFIHREIVLLEMRNVYFCVGLAKKCSGSGCCCIEVIECELLIKEAVVKDIMKAIVNVDRNYKIIIVKKNYL